MQTHQLYSILCRQRRYLSQNPSIFSMFFYFLKFSIFSKLFYFYNCSKLIFRTGSREFLNFKWTGGRGIRLPSSSLAFNAKTETLKQRATDTKTHIHISWGNLWRWWVCVHWRGNRHTDDVNPSRLSLLRRAGRTHASSSAWSCLAPEKETHKLCIGRAHKMY